MLIVTGAMTALPENFEALRQAALDHVHRSRTEPGCLSHSVSIDAENPLRLVFFEEWEDRAALDLHFAQPGSRLFMTAVRELADEQTKLKIYPVAPRA
jgi:quinol monooxygenase YgiN